MFREIPDETYEKAGRLIKAVSMPDAGGEDRALVDVVAGAALALEQGASNALYNTVPMKTAQLLRQGTNPWQFLHRSTARYLDEIEHNGDHVTLKDGSPNALRGVSFIVNNAKLQMTAHRVNGALKMRDLMPRLGEAELELFEEAKRDEGFAESLRHVEVGQYDRLDQDYQADLHDSLASPVLNPELREAVVEYAGHIDSARSIDASSVSRQFAENPWEMGFDPLNRDVLAKVESYYQTWDSKDLNEWEKQTLDEFAKLREFGAETGSGLATSWEINAAARALQDPRSAENDLALNVSRMVSDAGHQNEASARLIAGGHVNFRAREDDRAVAAGRYHEASEQAQDTLAMEIAGGALTSPIDRLRIEKVAGFVETEMSPTFDVKPEKSAANAMYAAAMASRQMGM